MKISICAKTPKHDACGDCCPHWAFSWNELKYNDNNDLCDHDKKFIQWNTNA